LRFSFVCNGERPNCGTVENMIDRNPQGVRNCCVKIRNGHGIFDHFFASFGGFAMNISTFETAPGEDARKCLGVMVSANILINLRSAAELCG